MKTATTTTTTAPAWCARYVGIPFADRGRHRGGLDCWGLVRLVYADLLRVELPSYLDAYRSCMDRDGVSNAITGNMESWSKADQGGGRVFDVVLFRVRLAAWHVGVCVGAGLFLHVHAGINTAIERAGSPVWSRRVMGYYRYAR